MVRGARSIPGMQTQAVAEVAMTLGRRPAIRERRTILAAAVVDLIAAEGAADPTVVAGEGTSSEFPR